MLPLISLQRNTYRICASSPISFPPRKYEFKGSRIQFLWQRRLVVRQIGLADGDLGRVTYHTSSYQTRRADPQETASNVSQTAEICHTHMHISQMSTVTHFTWLCHRQLRGVPGYLLTHSDIRQNGKIYLPIGSFSRKSLCLCDPLCDIYINPRKQFGLI